MNKDSSIWEENLIRSAKCVRVCMLNSLPDPVHCEHPLSPALERGLTDFYARHKRVIKLYTALKSTVAIILAAILSLSVWLTIDGNARADFARWVRVIYKDSIVYQFFGEKSNKMLPDYLIGFVPQGYFVETVYQSETSYSAVYARPNNPNDAFVFEYFFAADGAQTQLLLEEEEYLHEKIIINGLPGDLYLCASGKNSNNLLWFDERHDVILSIDSYADKSVILHIAESVYLKDSPK